MSHSVKQPIGSHSLYYNMHCLQRNFSYAHQQLLPKANVYNF